MANRTNSLVISARIDGLGWRRGSILNSKNGRVKDGYMIYNGVEYPTIKASYQIRSYNSEGKAVDTGSEPTWRRHRPPFPA
jgi:hypothetical protein